MLFAESAHNETDRGIEAQIKFNAAYQLFCGKTVVKGWHCPDRTRIQEFRSRLSPETHCFLANEIAHLAVKKRFANPQHIDIDSTIQEPDMQHPSISNMLIKVSGMARSLQKLLMEKCDLSQLTDTMKHIDLKKIKGLARQYFFIKSKKSPKHKEKEVDVFNKQKEHKTCEFGRQFQIGRIEGNFVWSVPNSSIRMPDAHSFKPMVRGHLNTFQQPIISAGADKGYYSKDNVKFLLDLKVPEVALQRQNRKYNDPPDNPLSPERYEELVNRRSGIEGVIGHLKRRFQMGRSRMKSDRTTESSGYCSMLGFNLSQLTRFLTGEALKKAA